MLRFVPIAFIADFHGFALFAPYVALVLAILQISRWRASAKQLA